MGQTNQSVRDTAKEGDIIKFNRGPYCHYAVYVGNGKVVHLSSDAKAKASCSVDPMSSKSWANTGTVRTDDIDDVAGSSKAEIDNTKDKKFSRFSPKETVKRALSKVGPADYNIATNNCEHFASECRYGTKDSEQIENFRRALYGTVVIHDEL